MKIWRIVREIVIHVYPQFETQFQHLIDERIPAQIKLKTLILPS